MDCIFHSDKYAFDNVRKELQKAKVLPRIFGARLAMAVCSCRKQETSLDSKINGDLSEELLVLSTEINKPKWDQFPTTKSFLEEILQCRNLSASQKKLVLVIDQALDENFDALKEEFRAGRLEELNRAINRKKKPRCNHLGVAYVIKKKMKRALVKREATLPIFGGNSKLLENECGKGFVKVGKMFNCVVKFESEKTRAFMDKNLPKTIVTIWCQSLESFEEILTHLRTAANRIQLALVRVYEARKERAKAYRDYRWQLSIDYYDHDDPQQFTMKEELADDYTKKSHSDRKHNKHHRVNKEELSPLKGGRCMNCFKDFQSLKTATDDVCQYHSGYIKYLPEGNYWVWSCCSYTACSRQNDTHELHSGSGCCSGRHVWRRHSKASRGVKSEKMYWQRILKRR